MTSAGGLNTTRAAACIVHLFSIVIAMGDSFLYVSYGTGFDTGNFFLKSSGTR
jgi:hypothetical protein